MTKTKEAPSQELIELYVRSGDPDKTVAISAQREIAKALELPLRKGVMAGNINLFTPSTDGTDEFPLDLLAPGTETQHVAYTNPGHGYIPQRSVESDYVRISTYSVASSIDFLLSYARKGNWDILGRAMGVLEDSFVKKMNDDAWHTVLAAVADRNILVYDADAANGQLTKRLVSLLKTVMRRNAGGNSVSSRGRLTDLYLSIEGVEDIRNWGIDQLDDTSRREVYQAADSGAPLTRIYGVNLHDLFELGDGQEYQDYFINDLGGSLSSGDTELVIGVDTQTNDSFIMPVKMPVTIFEDETLHRSQRQGYYGWAEVGFGVLDGRRVIAGSF